MDTRSKDVWERVAKECGKLERAQTQLKKAMESAQRFFRVTQAAQKRRKRRA